MDYTAFVEDIVKEVQKRIQKESNSIRKRLVVIGTLAEEDYTFLEKLFSVVPLKEASQMTEMCDGVLITEISLTSLGNLATGCGKNEIETFILKSLMQGIPVCLLEKGLEYRQYKKTASKTLYQLYSEYESKLVQYGMKLISNICNVLNDTMSGQEVDFTISEIDLTAKKLLLESDLLKKLMKEPATIKIAKQCIITPLAEDYIRYHNLTIKRV